MILKIIVFLFYSIPFLTFSQSWSSLIYNQSGQLYLDTSLKLNEDKLFRWTINESFILFHLSKSINFPTFPLEANIKDTVIVAITIDSSDFIKEMFFTRKGKHPQCGLDSAVYQGIKNSEMIIAKRLKKLNNSNGIDIYYIPIIFDPTDFYEKVKAIKAIPISGQANYPQTIKCH